MDTVHINSITLNPNKFKLFRGAKNLTAKVIPMLNRTFAGFHGLLIGGNEAVYCRKIHKNQSLDCSKGGAGHDHLSMLFRIFAVYIKLGLCVRNLLLALCLSYFSIMEPALAETKPSFTPDANVQKVADAYAQDAVDMAKKQFNISLDWSDSSIANVEKALAMMHSSFIATNPRPTEEQAMSFAKGFGSYIGEVYRRNHGAEWGIVSLNEQKFPGLQTKSGINFWPWGRALNRIMQGPENNVADYYRALLEKQP